MNHTYWKENYKMKERQQPSQFFRMCQTLISKDDVVLDVGAGDGRDTFPISKICKEVYYVEPNNELPFIGFKKIDDVNIYFNIMYARWVIHSVSKETENKIIECALKNKANLMLEFRVTGDSTADDSHPRRLIDFDAFMYRLQDKGYFIQYRQVGNGLSKVGRDDPLLARVIACIE